MRKQIFGHFRLKMFRGVYTSMLGVMLLTCGIMGIAMLNYSMKRMQQEENRLMESKIHTVAVDLENQISSMREMLADAAGRQELRWERISAGKYNEFQAATMMKSYDKPSDIWDLCFLKYQNYDNILTSKAEVLRLEVYLGTIYEKEDIQAAQRVLERMYQSSDKQCEAYSSGDKTLFLIPALQVGENKTNKMVIGFEVSQKSIGKRVTDLVGELEGDFFVFYDGQLIYGEAASREEEETMLQQASQAGDFAVYYIRPEHQYFSWRSVFTARGMFGVLAIGIFMLLLIFGLTVWNYRPVRKLAEKYISFDNGAITSPLDYIDQMIDDLQKNKEKDDKMLHDQSLALREQLAYMAISGYNLDTLKNYMTLLNIDYNNSMYGIIDCRIGEKRLREMGKLIEAIVDLSENGMLLYPCHHREIGIKVLVIAEEGYQFSEAVEMLQSLFITLNMNVLVRFTRQSTNLEDWWEVAADETKVEKESVQDVENMRGIVKQMLRYVEKHLGDYDLSLGVVAQNLETHPSYLSRVFKQEMKIGFKEYVVEMRMDKAKELLSKRGYSVGEVCHEIGYANTSYFIKMFQKATCMTPAKFKEQCDETKGASGQ